MSQSRHSDPPLPDPTNESYAADVTASARDVAAVLRERVPGLDVLRLHKFLYYCQGHHLAAFGKPLFSENIFAWNNGPVVSQFRGEERYDSERPDPKPITGEAELNTIGYVLSRYGSLSGNDLINLTHNETPWRTADTFRQPNDSVQIKPEWMREYFSTEGAPGAGDEEGMRIDSRELAKLFEGAEERRREPGQVDDLGEIRRRLAALV
ncbi:Panacea domain-containing protein [Catenulispora pinisilvae]|uniref:Panacea domain-containing protein n=1 Tax=Catenulispora pinisilvae TaxID=2705253 RepID=UPI001E3E6C6B|nr:type II toxin-antitoxin system antitoxin SocA domain-containing protein [Catenulispora pinisilvae]